MNKETKLKITISEKATDLYLRNKRFTIQNLAKETQLSSADIYELFPNRSSILRFFYESRILLYKKQLTSIEDYNEYTLSEKLNNLFLTLLDQFLEHREFVLQTYNNFAACSTSRSKFKELFIDEIEAIFQNDNNISSSSKIILNSLFYHSVFYQFNALIGFWKKDESTLYEQSMVLTDKWSAFVQEVFYTKIIDRGFDFGKLLIYNSPFRKYMNKL